ncbi:MAG TPA: ABC transporter permease [Nitrolancea sp.]|nr:ABC transporter permease [Nitrolancea sp.]
MTTRVAQHEQDQETRRAALSGDRPKRPNVLQRFATNRFALVSAIFLIVILVAALLAPVIAPYDPNRITIGAELQGPSFRHLLGTDPNGRDVFSRILFGARISLSIGVIAMLISVFVGTTLGAVSGYFSGWVDSLAMRLTDAMLAIPVFFLLLAVLASLGPTVPTIVVAIGLTSWMTTARVVRSEVLRAVNLDYVLAAELLGASRSRIIVRHLVPQALPSMLVASTLGVAQAILIASALSYLGVGVQPPTASWGNMLSNAQSYVFSEPMLAIWPGLMILFTVLAFNFIGDALRDALSPYQN